MTPGEMAQARDVHSALHGRECHVAVSTRLRWRPEPRPKEHLR
jgi:hypothetical protein